MQRCRYIFLVVAMISVMLPGIAQNLLQNPSFESATSWDEFWELSTVLPSSETAVATEITTDAHEGLKSVELSNTVGNKWTYLYSDSVNAPLSFEAGQRYLIKGWIKSIEAGKDVSLSVNWNTSQEQLIFYDGNPDPVTNPDWFMVVDTITASADFDDGYLSLGIRALKSGLFVTGKLLLDDFSVTRLPSRETDITYFSIAEQIGDAFIGISSHTVTIDIPTGTDVTALVPDISLSAFATIVPGSGVATDFSTPFLYMVTAEDGFTTQAWTVVMNILPPFSDTEILSFSIPEQTGPATIDNVFHTVIVETAYGTDLSSIIPIIGLAPGASVNPGSDIPTDLTSPIIYTVTAQDGITKQDYIIVAMNSPISNETDILSFSIAEEVDPAIIDELWHAVSIEVPYGTDVTALVPVIEISDRATILPGSDVPGDFTAPLTYAVLAEDGTTSQDWTVTVIMKANDQTDIESFSIAEEAGPAIIDELWHTVSIEVPSGTDPSALVPAIELSAGAQSLPGSDVPGDFTVPLIYTVIAEDGTTRQIWTVTVLVLPNKQTDIESYSLANQVGPESIDKLSHTVSLEVPYGTDVSALAPTIELSDGATIAPISGVARDFSKPVTYTVTAEDGTTIQDWMVSVSVLLNNQTDIESFSLAKSEGPARIDKLSYRVLLEVPYGSDVSALVPAITISAGATIDPGSGFPVDFSNPVTYLVTAEDGVTRQDWTVTVSVLPNNQTDIESFSLADAMGPAKIDKLLHTVSLAVPYGTDITTLAPTIALSAGATILPGSDVSTDFTSTVIYTVIAEDGVTEQDWITTVLVLPNNQTDIESFTLADEVGPADIDILLHTVSIVVAEETDLSNLVPVIELSEGASIDPGRGIVTDFTAPVEYMVTAEDGVSSQIWTVTVTSDQEAVKVNHADVRSIIKIYPNPAKEFVNIELPEKGDIYLIDISGRVAISLTDVAEKVLIPVSDLERGMYLIHVKWSDSHQVFKLMLD